MTLNDLLDAIAFNEWPETEAEIKAELAKPAEPYTDEQAAAMIAAILTRRRRAVITWCDDHA